MTVPTSRRPWVAGQAAVAAAVPDGANVDGPGVGVLAGLVGALGDTALTNWLAAFRSGTATAGVFGRGQAGFAAGLAVAADVDPRLATLAGRTRRGVVDWGRALAAPEALCWQDYDLIAGPSGALLALTVAGRATPAEIEPFAGYLSRLAEDPGLAGLRLSGYAGDSLRGWNQGAVNLGLGHGVPGVVVALAAARRLLGPRQDVLTALRHCAGVLVDTAATGAGGLPVWPPSDRAATSEQVSRQAWCYGTPGVAWALWEAGDALADAELRAFAVEAMTGLDRHWDPAHHLYGDTAADLFGVCHGAAGVLAVADAFARHAAHARAVRLRDRIADWVHEHADDVAELAATDLTLLNGAAGVLAVLSTVDGGRRDWLPLLGLR